MPSISLRLGSREDTTLADDFQSTGNDSPTGTDSSRALIITAVIAGAISLAACLFVAILTYNRRRQRRKEEHQKLASFSREGFVRKKRKMSAADRQFEEEERQRSIMIRKSLASRSSRSMSQVMEMDRIEREEEEEELSRQKTLKDDWKEWEARLQRERTLSGERHPSTTLLPLPEPSDLPAIPPPSRSRSSSRSPQHQRQQPSPPPKPLPPRRQDEAMATFFPEAAGKNGEFKEDLNNILMCKDCKENPPNLIEEFSSGDMVCTSCGVVVGERIIDTRSEWRTFSNDDQGNDDPSRVGDGPNLMIDGDQLQTTIAFDGKNARNLSHLQNKITQDKSSKVLLQAYRDIQSLTESINTGAQVANAAKHIFKLVEDNKALKGKSQEAIIAGCIFIACRQTGVPRTFREIYSLTKVSKKEIGRVFKQLENFLQKMGGEAEIAKASVFNQTYTAKGSTSAVELCARYCSNLNFRMPVRIEDVARQLAAASTQVADLAGRSPLSVAAACIYMASHMMGEARNSKEIAGVAGVSDGTVKTAYRHLYQARDALVAQLSLPEGEVNLDKLPVN
ncbi:hypothetical protein QBC46DRAFT_263083 [Diplogelasinospora grovesii]|uniref:Transcription initiation factor IIB n=1 Tax=Diplogelasinospora grovesii TaxID=303347 RepID=A0AAN6N6L6_9PEZI|nr:hypothetical protein QBC46DRAFT_263083 [Diplogelasinospora grovesii]